MIKPWIFEFFGAPVELHERFDASQSPRYFDAYLDLWASAEPAGFEGIFFSEHHFGAAYSPAPNLLIANVATRTRTLRLGTLGMVAPYHTPWQLIEEIGMLDHLTGGRLEIGTAAGIPNEMEKVGLGHDEARARNDEILDILDAALKSPVISHHGKFWHFDNLRLTPRPLQQPSPPVWVTVVSASSARKAARRGAKLCTGFHPLDKIIEIFDAFRDEAEKAGRKVGPDDLCIRRQVTMVGDEREVAAVVDAQLATCANISKPIRDSTRPTGRRSSTPRRRMPSRSATTKSSPARPTRWRTRSSRSARRQAPGILRRPSTGRSRRNILKEWYADYGEHVIPKLRRAAV